MCVIIFKVKDKLRLICHPLFKSAFHLEGGNPSKAQKQCPCNLMSNYYSN